MSTAAQTVSGVKASRPKPSAWRELRRLIPYLGPYKGATAFGLLTLVLMGLIGALPPLIIGIITDCLTRATEPMPNLTAPTHAGAVTLWHTVLRPIMYFYQPGSQHTLLVLCFLLVGAVVVKGVFSFASRWILIGISRDIEFDLRNNLLARLVQMEPEYYVRNRTGDLMSRCTNDLGAVRMVLGPGIMYSANTIVGMAVAIAVMVKISPLLTLEVLVPVPVVFITVRYFGTVIHELQTKIQAMLATLSAKAQENLTGIRVVRAYGQEAAETESFDEANRQYVGENIRMIRAWSMFFPALQLIIGFSILFVLWQGSRMVVQGRMTLGAFTAFYFFVGLLVFPMIALGFVTNIFQRGAASMGRLNYILDGTPGINDEKARGEHQQALRGEIEFRDLTFTYPTTRSGNGAKPAGSAESGNANEPVLRDINLRIPAGSTVAIVGPTGSGKTTLAALIVRLWEAPTGSLFIDGKPIREWPLAALRRAVGFVPQDAFLFSETIRENIEFGVDETQPNAMEEAAQIASISGDISDFPARYETIVGERGIT
ncbi:MAG: ABC transporter ATP-binding protein, partial [Candidatus Acidiferrales bacterium]